MTEHIHGGWHRAPAPAGAPRAIAALNLGTHWSGPLVCAACGIPWPGEPLTEPYESRNAGYGELAELMPWRRRVSAMVHDLDHVA